MTKFQKNLLNVIRASFVALAIFFLIWILNDPNYNKWGGVAAGIGLPFLPQILKLIFKKDMPFRVQMMYYIFLFVALDLGICWDWYKTVPFYDKIVHGGSGVLSAVVGYAAIEYYKANKTARFFKILVIVSICVLIGVLWEYFEFFCDKCLGQSMQQLVSVGVDDTMFDLLSATVGGIIGAFIVTMPNFAEKISKKSSK